jgi:hypothetical protein
MKAPKNDHPAHQPFSFLDKSVSRDPNAHFAETTFNICNGIAMCLELAHCADLERTHNDDCDAGKECRPAIGIVETERLLMFAQSAARMLSANAERHIDQLNAAGVAKQGGVKQ